jgi:hypothetical protein
MNVAVLAAETARNAAKYASLGIKRGIGDR